MDKSKNDLDNCDDGQVNKAISRAYKYLSFRRRTVWEMEKYLMEKGYNSSVVDQTLAQLMELNLLDDSCYAYSYAEEKVELTNNPIGPYKLQYELRNRGIDGEIISNVLDRFYGNSDQETELARKSLIKKYYQIDLSSDKDLRRAANYLERRGFSYSVIKELLFS